MRIAKIVLATIILLAAPSPADAVEGIALSTHREFQSSDAGPGVHPSMFGSLVKHVVKDSKVTESSVLYDGKARCAVINQPGTQVAFIKLDGKIQVINMDGSGLKELTNAQNRNASWLAWPTGDWVYYTQEGLWPTGDWWRGKSTAEETKTIRRVHVVSGQDEEVWKVHTGIWQMSMAANAGKTSGRFTITGHIMDFSNPGKTLNPKELSCGTYVSFDGKYVTEVQGTHADMFIYEWPTDQLLTSFEVNEFTDQPDGRVSFYRPRWSVNSNAWRVMTHGADFGCVLQTNMVLYNWKDQKQIQITHNPLNSEASDEGEAFWLAGVANDFAGTGLTEGEVPLTVELGEGLIEGDWNWDFGDGTKGSAPVGKHTFTKVGEYLVTATQGGRTLKQTVTVLEKNPPSLLRADVLDEQRMALTFDQPVTLTEPAKVELENGKIASSLTPLRESSRILAEWSEPLPSQGNLTLSGIQDTAQEPNAVASTKHPFAKPAWPVSREKLAYVWSTKDELNSTYNTKTKMDLPSRVWVWDGLAKFNRYGGMEIDAGGNFTAGDEMIPMYNQMVEEAGGSTMELLIQPGNLIQNRVIVDYGSAANLRQAGNELHFYLKAGEDKGSPENAIPIAVLKDLKPVHIVLTYASDKLTIYLDGKKVGEKSDFKGKQKNTWEGASLNFGGGRTANKDAWKGSMQNVALYGRQLSEDEISRNFAEIQKVLAGRKIVETYEIRAEMTATSAVQSVAEIAPYDDALIVNEFKVLESGNPEAFPPGSLVRVAQWGIEQKKLLSINDAKPGDSAVMRIEKLSENPQLESIFVKDKLPKNFELELYFNPDENISLATENLNLQIPSAKTPVNVDGNPEDWDLSGGVFVCGDVQNSSDRQSLWFHAKYDEENLYLLARWNDATPMNNPGVAASDPGFTGDSLQVRIVTAPDVMKKEVSTPEKDAKEPPDARTTHITSWIDKNKIDVIRLEYGCNFDESGIDGKTAGVRQAFVESPDKRGYTQEISIPWNLLTISGMKIKTGDRILITLEPNFTQADGQRLTLKDIFRNNTPVDRSNTFMNSACWGIGTLSDKSNTNPRSVRLSNGKEYPVRMENNMPVIDWTDLLKNSSSEGR